MAQVQIPERLPAKWPLGITLNLIYQSCIPELFTSCRILYMTTAAEISERITESVMAQKLAPGARLGEQQLAQLFNCSRTIVREALIRLAARGIVTVSSRRGWYVVELTVNDAREAFEARQVIEMGLIRRTQVVSKAALKRLKNHIARQKAAAAGGDVGLRSFLLADFHVCLAECLGNNLLAETVRDMTARTILIAMLNQSAEEAEQSCHEHALIVEALEKRDFVLAEKLMHEHIGESQSRLNPESSAYDPLSELRSALSPMQNPI